MRVLFALSGLNRIERGAEIAFKAVASELAKMGHEVTMLGSGSPHEGSQLYGYRQGWSIPREKFERFPRFPSLRNETAWEDMTFAASVLRSFDPAEYDVTLTCAYPFTNWALRRSKNGARTPHVFVTQNGDWPAWSNSAEFKWFKCDGLVCTNPEYFERNREKYRSALIPNGVDLDRFCPAGQVLDGLDRSGTGPVILMVSALIPSKNVAAGIEAASLVPGARLIVAGDGPLRAELQELGKARLPERYTQCVVPGAEMPALYRSADVFLHLSEDESFGNVFVEALACGVPIVARDRPNTRWILEEAGYWARSLAPDEIAVQLKRSLASDQLAIEARVARASAFSWPNIAAQYAQFLEEVAAGSK